MLRPLLFGFVVILGTAGQAPAASISHTWHDYSLGAAAIGGVTCTGNGTGSAPPNTDPSRWGSGGGHVLRHGPRLFSAGGRQEHLVFRRTALVGHLGAGRYIRS